jgi:Pyridoxamine 5'-phosphate oxidase
VTQQQPDLDAVARATLEVNHYMTLGTADAAGRPWVSPVFFAPDRRTPVNP